MHINSSWEQWHQCCLDPYQLTHHTMQWISINKQAAILCTAQPFSRFIPAREFIIVDQDREAKAFIAMD